MRNTKIVADSAANLLELPQAEFAFAPLKIATEEREFTDDAELDVDRAVQYFFQYKGTSKTSCPNPSDWLEAFGDADDIFCVTITSGLSGSYNAACAAKEIYEKDHPGRRVCVIDSLSAGPEMELMVEKLEELVVQGCAFEEIGGLIENYKQQTGLFFVLESLKNFAANGRVSPAVAKITGVLGIRVVGTASDQGTLKPLHKCRGQGRALEVILNELKASGLRRGKVRIAHCLNPVAAQELSEMILLELPEATVEIRQCRGLCSYYAERGGMLVGFEKI